MKKDSKYSKKLIYIGGLLLMLLIALGAISNIKLSGLNATDSRNDSELSGNRQSIFNEVEDIPEPSEFLYFTTENDEKKEKIYVSESKVLLKVHNESHLQDVQVIMPDGIEWNREQTESYLNKTFPEFKEMIEFDFQEDSNVLVIHAIKDWDDLPLIFTVREASVFVMSIVQVTEEEDQEFAWSNTILDSLNVTGVPDKKPSLLDVSLPQTEIEVTPKNFLDYFVCAENATYSYDSKTGKGIATLTPNEAYKKGAVTLKKKISMKNDFSISGKVNLGTKDQNNGGADGVAFGFHSGNVTEVGRPGGHMGVGGLPNAFGFALDTYYNGTINAPYPAMDPDPPQFGGKYPGPDTGGVSYAGFMRTKKVQDVYKKYMVDGNGGEALKQIQEPSNNTFRPILFDYVASSDKLDVTYPIVNGSNHTWSANIKGWYPTNLMAFFISAGTGKQYNLQQFEIIRMTFKSDGQITTRYVDELTGNEIVSGETFEGIMGDTQQNVFNTEKNEEILEQNFIYSKVEYTEHGLYNDNEHSAIFSDQPLTVTYYYYKIGAPKVSKHVFNEAGTPVGVGEAGDKTVRIGDTIRYQIIGENANDNSLIRLDSFYDKLPDGLDMVKENGKVKGRVTITQDGQPTESEFTNLNPIFNPTDENWEFLYDKDLIKISDKDRKDTVELNFYAAVTADAASKPKNVVTLETKIPKDGSVEADVEFQIVSDVITKYVYEESPDDIIEIDGKEYTATFTGVVGEKESVFNETWNQTLRRKGYVRKKVIVEPVDLKDLYDNSTDKATFPPTKEPLVIKYVYGPRSNVKIHLRQVIDKPSRELVVPSEGYFHLGKTQANAPAPPIQSMGTVTKSHTEHQPVIENDFTHLDLILFPGESVVLVQPIIPEYYDYVGYVATSEEGGQLAAHVPPTRQRILTKVPIKLDYETKDEYWVSVYIRPTFAENEIGPRVYSWDYQKNRFGRLKLLP